MPPPKTPITLTRNISKILIKCYYTNDPYITGQSNMTDCVGCANIAVDTKSAFSFTEQGGTLQTLRMRDKNEGRHREEERRIKKHVRSTACPECRAGGGGIIPPVEKSQKM